MGRGIGNPLVIGLRAANEYRRPIVILCGLALAAVLAYYLIPAVPGLMAPIGVWQESSGWPASFLICAVFCGAVPYVIYKARGVRGPRRPLLVAFAQMLWCGLSGVACNWFFGIQAGWFGNGHDVVTVLSKACVDQFGWTVLVIAPANAVFYAVLAGGLLVDGRRVRLGEFLERAYLPNLVMNWCIGLPSNLAAYYFLLELQIVFLGLLSSVWVVICVCIGVRYR